MLSLYCGNKCALDGFSESLSYELASQGIVVKNVEPRGVASTNVCKRSGTEAAGNSSLAGYESFATQFTKILAGLRVSRLATEKEAAKIIFEAATYGTDRLHYLATADIKPPVKARRETTEPEYTPATV